MSKNKQPSVSDQLKTQYDRLEDIDTELTSIQSSLISIGVDKDECAGLKSYCHMARAAMGHLMDGTKRLQDKGASGSIEPNREYDLRAAALRVGVSEQTLRKWLKNRKLIGKHLGAGRGYYVVKGQELLRTIAVIERSPRRLF